MPDRLLRYRFETEDRASAGLNDIEKNATSLEVAMRSVAEVERIMGASAEEAAKQSLLFAEAQEILRDEGIQTTSSIEAQIVKYNLLLDQYKEDAVATQQIAGRKQALQGVLESTLGSTTSLGAATGQTTQFLNNFAFSLNDAQQFQFGFDQGLRAISNNIGVMIGQFQGVVAQSTGFKGALKTIGTALAGPVGLSVAFGAVSTAAILLQGVFKDTEKASGETADTLEEQFAPLIKILDAVQGSFEVTFDNLEERQLQAQGDIESTTATITRLERELNRARSASGVGVGQSLSQAGNITRQLEEQRELLKDQNDELAFINAQLLDEQKKREIIAEGEKFGFNFTKEQTEEEKRQAELLEEEERKKKELDKIREKEKTDLDLLKEKREELSQVLSVNNFGQLQAAVLAEREVEALERAIEARRALLNFQFDRAEIEDAFGSVFDEVGIPDGAGFDELESLLPSPEDSALRAKQISDAIISEFRTLPPAVLAEAEEVSRILEENLQNDIQGFIDLGSGLESAIESSLVGGITSLGEALGDIAAGTGTFTRLGQGILLSLADLATNIGKQMIQFGVAGLALKALVANPVGAIIAGTALVALGRAASSSVQGAIDRAGRGGGGGSAVSASRFTSSSSGPAQTGTTAFRGGGLALGVPTTEELEARIQRERDARERDLARAIPGRRTGFGLSSSAFGNNLGSLTLKNQFETTVLPGGDILLSVREALEKEVELGGSGTLEG